jgi:uncharacterized membrane protein
MRTHVAEATIGRPADEIWGYAADILRHTEWMSVTEARVVAGTGTETGARGVERLAFGPVTRDVEFEVADAVPGRRLLWRSLGDRALDLEVELTLEPDGPSTTHARYRGSYALHGRWRLLAPLMALEGRAGVRRELIRLKDNVEAVAPAVAPAT